MRAHVLSLSRILTAMRLVLASVLGWGMPAGFQSACAASPGPLPNLVIIFTDDQGYADVGVFGAKGFKTPNLDRLAAGGRIFRNFHVAQPVCSASRAGLLTGCYPNRIGIHGALGPRSKVGISSNETTLAELVKQRGYATAIFGKWHLGDAPQFLPLRHGFDEYFGLPYSNDMWPLHPDLVKLPPNDEKRKRGYPDLVMFDGDKIAIPQVTHEDQNQLTTWYTQHAVKFIEKNKERPFFLYLAHNMPHVPLHVSDKFRGHTERGLYGDVIEEIDWSVGQVMDALQRSGLEDKGHIPAGTECNDMLMTIDLLPTIAKLIDAALPAHKLDGLDVWPIISGQPHATNPHLAYWFYYEVNQLQAVVSGDGRWKLQLPHTYRTLAGRPGGHGGTPAPYEQRKLEKAELYDLASDMSETADVADRHPEVVKHLEAEAEKAREELGDALTHRIGKGVREPGRVALEL